MDFKTCFKALKVFLLRELESVGVVSIVPPPLPVAGVSPATGDRGVAAAWDSMVALMIVS
jgi:hypothetical protein